LPFARALPLDPDHLSHSSTEVPARVHGNARLREALIGPLREVYGVSDKVLTMTLSCVLLTAPRDYEIWRQVGATMIAIDTLVHNFLHRTRILAVRRRPYVVQLAAASASDDS
jgi:hypothetical protein